MADRLWLAEMRCMFRFAGSTITMDGLATKININKDAVGNCLR